jgi:ABC-2 type transport system permease protein
VANAQLGEVALRVPPSTVQIPKLARFQLHEYVRSRRFYALIGIVVAIGAILTTVIAYYRTTLTNAGLLSGGLAFYGTFWGGGIDLVIVLAAVFFGGDAIAGEFQNKTGYFLMGLPIRRTTVYVGKFIAAYLASVAIMLLYLAILIGNGVVYLHGGFLPWQLGVSLLLALTYLAAVMGATFLFSSLFKTSAYGFVLTAILFLFGFTLIEDLVVGLTNLEPWMVISYAESTIGNVFANNVNWGFGATTSLSVGRMRLFNPGIGEGLVIMLGYFFLTAAAGLFLFEREEFT